MRYMNSLNNISPYNLHGYDFILDNAKKAQGLSKFEDIFKEALENKQSSFSGPSDKLLDVCYEMESLFIGTMLDTMRKTVHETDFFGKSIAKDIFSDMLYDEYAQLMAKTDHFGLARQIYRQLRE